MARKIDRIALYCLIFIIGFAGMQNAVKNPFFALALTILFVYTLSLCDQKWLGKFVKARQEKARRIKAARRLIDRWAITPDEPMANAYLKSRYPDACGYAFCLVPKDRMTGKLTTDEMLALWRSHTTHINLVIATTGGIDDGALTVANTLTTPNVRLISGGEYIQIIANSDMDIPACEQTRAPFVPKIFPLHKKRAPQCALYTLFMLLTYWVTGQITYLIAGLSLLGLSLHAMKQPKPPKRLFR